MVVTRPLSDYRVVELGTGSALAYCGKLFADFGADVLKIEPPGGDPGRQEGPLVDAGGGRQESGYFAWLNTNKRSSFAPPAIAEADILLDGRPLAELNTGPLAHDKLREAAPHLIIVAVSWFGESGPYRDFIGTDMVARALAGVLHIIGPLERPVGINDHQADIMAGLSAFTAAVSGILSGEGRRFSVSIHEAATVFSEPHAANPSKAARGRRGVNRFFNSYPSGVFKCREGWLGVGAGPPAQWQAFCKLFGMTEAAADPRFVQGDERSRAAKEIEAQFVPKLLERTAEEWFADAIELRLPFAIVPDMKELLEHRMFRGFGAFAPVRIGNASFQAPVLAQRLPRTPPSPGGTTPLAGEAGTPRPASTAPRLKPARADPSLPLAGVHVLDLTMGWAGPVATRQLADLGAEVIKVEALQYFDWWRGNDNRPIAFEERRYEKRTNYLVLNRNKTGITLDLTRPEGKALLKRLVARCDAVIENYSRDVLPKFELDYEVLRQIKPDLVMVSMPAFPPGEWERGRAYGSTLEQAAGVPSVAGDPDMPPMMNHFAYGDAIGGFNATAALLLGVLHHRVTGEGQHIELSQVQCMLPMIAPWIIEQSVTGSMTRLGNRHPRYVPQNVFRCAGDDEWVLVSVTDDGMWQRLCRVIERPDLVGFTTAEARRGREEEIEAAIGAWTAGRGADAAMETLQAGGVAAGAVRSPFDIGLCPHLRARGHWQRVDRPWSGPHDQPSMPFREGDAPYPVRHPAPTLGEFNTEVLGGILGLTDAELAELERKGIIGTEATLPTGRRAPLAAAS